MNLRPSGYEPDELPDCSTPRQLFYCMPFGLFLYRSYSKMDGGGFEPPKQFAADLQSVPFGHSGIHPDFFILCINNRYYTLCCSIMQADDRTRTDNLLITNQLLFQLSHIGIRMDGEGFEPSKALPTDLQSAPFGHSGIHP